MLRFEHVEPSLSESIERRLGAPGQQTGIGCLSLGLRSSSEWSTASGMLIVSMIAVTRPTADRPPIWTDALLCRLLSSTGEMQVSASHQSDLQACAAYVQHISVDLYGIVGVGSFAGVPDFVLVTLLSGCCHGWANLQVGIGEKDFWAWSLGIDYGLYRLHCWSNTASRALVISKVRVRDRCEISPRQSANCSLNSCSDRHSAGACRACLQKGVLQPGGGDLNNTFTACEAMSKIKTPGHDSARELRQAMKRLLCGSCNAPKHGQQTLAPKLRRAGCCMFRASFVLLTSCGVTSFSHLLLLHDSQHVPEHVSSD